MKTKTTDQIVSTDELENARWGYQVAISCATLYAETIWSIFNAMLVANSIVVAGISFVGATQSLNLFIIFLQLIGLVLCFVWFLLIKRHREFTAYYVLSAREIEERYFLKSVKTLSRGGDFADGKSVILDIGQSKIKRQMSIWARLTRGEAASYIVILVFALIYISTFFI